VIELGFEPQSSDLLGSMVPGHDHSLSYSVRLILAVRRERKRKQAIGQKAVQCKYVNMLRGSSCSCQAMTYFI